MTQNDAYSDSEGRRIDPSHWLPLRTSVVTPEREAKGDLKIDRFEHKDGIRFAQAQVRNILNHLHERDVLDHQHVHDGETFELWQMWFTAELSCRPSTIYGPEMQGVRRALAEDDLAHDDYSKLIRGLSKQHIRLIELAVKAPATEHNAFLAMQAARQYRDAFDRLGVVMERLRAAYREKQNAAG